MIRSSPSMVACLCSCIRPEGLFRIDRESSDGKGKIDPDFIKTFYINFFSFLFFSFSFSFK